MTIKKIIMQGTVWGSLCCTATMDKLPKAIYNTPSLLYKYKGEVSVPPLEMVDDILTVQKCGIKSLEMNAEVNAFIELKKLKLAKRNVCKFTLETSLISVNNYLFMMLTCKVHMK